MFASGPFFDSHLKRGPNIQCFKLHRIDNRLTIIPAYLGVYTRTDTQTNRQTYRQTYTRTYIL